MKDAQLRPKIMKLKHEMITLRKLASETVTEFVNRSYSLRTQLLECDEVYPNDSDIINWIICGLDRKIWGNLNELVDSKPDAGTDISVLLPLLANREAAMEISKERFGPAAAPSNQEKKKSQYGVFGSYAHRGRGSYSSRGRGRGPHGGRGAHTSYHEKRCYECDSPDHLVNSCPYRERQPAPPSPAYRGGRSNRGGRGGNTQRGGHTNMHVHAPREDDRRQPPPPPKRVRYEEAPAPASAMKHQGRWRE
jgi:hypothetical protein